MRNGQHARGCTASTVLTFKIWKFPRRGRHLVSPADQGLWQHGGHLPTRQAGCHKTAAAPSRKARVFRSVPLPVAPAHSLRPSDRCWLLPRLWFCFCPHSLLSVLELTPRNTARNVRVQILHLEGLGSDPASPTPLAVCLWASDFPCLCVAFSQP